MRRERREGGHLSHVSWSHVSARVSRLMSHAPPSQPPGPPGDRIGRLGPSAPSRLSWWSRWSRSGSGGEAKCARVATKSAAAKHMSGAPLPLPLSGGASRVAARDHRDHQDHRDGLDLAPLERGIDGMRDSCRLGSGPARRAFRACPAALSGRPRWWAGRETRDEKAATCLTSFGLTSQLASRVSRLTPSPPPQISPCAHTAILLSFTSSAEEPSLARARIRLFSRGEKGKTT